MGLVHPIVAVGVVNGKLRPLAAIQLGSADPGWDMVQVVRRILTYFKDSQKYLDLELALAAAMSEDDWTRDPEEEYRAFKEELGNPPKKANAAENYDKLKSLNDKSLTPKFPFVQTCLFIGAISSRWSNNWYLHSVDFRPWNSAPNWGGKWMWEPGCTVINVTDLSYCFVLPGLSCFKETKKEKRRYARLARRPISAHDWLSAFSLESKDPARDIVYAYGNNKVAPIMSIESLQQAYPSILRDEDEQPKIDEEGGEAYRTIIFIRSNGEEEEEKEEEKEEEEEEEEDDSETDDQGEDESEAQSKQHEVTEEAPAAGKRPTDPEPLDTRDEAAIEELLVSGSQALLTNNEMRKGFTTTLKRFVREYPEKFRPECPGTVLLLLSALAQEKGETTRLELSRFTTLSGDQVVDIVKEIVALNAKHTKTEEGARPKPLALLDISFVASVTLAHVASILDLTELDELCIWHNPGLALEEVATVAKGRIAKATTRARFLEPLERRAIQGCRRHYLCRDDNPDPQPNAPLIAPTRTPIRQVVWMNLRTLNVDTSEPWGDKLAESQPQGLPGTLSLEQLSVETLAIMMHPTHSRNYEYGEVNNIILTELVPLPLHDIWMPLAELYTSLALIEEFMAQKAIIQMGHSAVVDRWPLVFPLMMATGDAKSEYAVTSPFPAEAFDKTSWEIAGGSFKKLLRTRGPDAIVHGEYTVVFLREADLGRLRYGLVTRDAQGQLQVCDPADVGDEAAQLAWSRGIGGLPRWEDKKMNTKENKENENGEELGYSNIALLDAGAVEKMFAAANELASRKDEIKRQL